MNLRSQRTEEEITNRSIKRRRRGLRTVTATKKNDEANKIYHREQTRRLLRGLPDPQRSFF